MTQRDRIIEYMEKYGSISTMEAFADLGITKLSTRISEMIREGAEISKTPETRLNRYGERVIYMRYAKAV